jgi:hypothetical protein
MERLQSAGSEISSHLLATGSHNLALANSFNISPRGDNLPMNFGDVSSTSMGPRSTGVGAPASSAARERVASDGMGISLMPAAAPQRSVSIASSAMTTGGPAAASVVPKASSGNSLEGQDVALADGSSFVASASASSNVFSSNHNQAMKADPDAAVDRIGGGASGAPDGTCDRR